MAPTCICCIFFNLEIINTNSGCPVCLGEGADTVDKPGETSKEGQWEGEHRNWGSGWRRGSSGRNAQFDQYCDAT